MRAFCFLQLGTHALGEEDIKNGKEDQEDLCRPERLSGVKTGGPVKEQEGRPGKAYRVEKEPALVEGQQADPKIENQEVGEETYLAARARTEPVGSE